MVIIGKHSSAPTHVASGVPQGSVLGPLLFSIYTSPIASIASSFSVPQQQFADDSQLYISLSPSKFHGQVHRLENCLTALHAWCCNNSLSLLILINLTLFSSVLGNALILSRL